MQQLYINTLGSNNVKRIRNKKNKTAPNKQYFSIIAVVSENKVVKTNYS